MADRKADWRKIALAFTDRVADVIDALARTINHVGPLTLTVDSYPTSESSFDSSGNIIAQFLRSLQRSLAPETSISRAAICPAGSP